MPVVVKGLEGQQVGGRNPAGWRASRNGRRTRARSRQPCGKGLAEGEVDGKGRVGNVVHTWTNGAGTAGRGRWQAGVPVE